MEEIKNKVRFQSIPLSISLFDYFIHFSFFSLREFEDILTDCQTILQNLTSESNESEINNLLKRREELVHELVNYPEVYDSLTVLISSSSSSSLGQPLQGQELQNTGRNEPIEREEGEGAIFNQMTGRSNNENDEINLADDVRKYFNEERMKREEIELNERSRRLFGGS